MCVCVCASNETRSPRLGERMPSVRNPQNPTSGCVDEVKAAPSAREPHPFTPKSPETPSTSLTRARNLPTSNQGLANGKHKSRRGSVLAQLGLPLVAALAHGLAIRPGVHHFLGVEIVIQANRLHGCSQCSQCPPKTAIDC